ncbi:MAG: hypothetical protein QM658_03110 [Gordonia sp. (in: high G+C Gram-positive bacteria)]
MSTPHQIDLTVIGCSEYLIAGQLLTLFAQALEDTRGGAADVAVVHPGEIVPDYGCGLATVRIVSAEVTTATQTACLVDEHRVVLELRMVRCYATPENNAMPAAGVLDSAVRDVVDDARAMRAAITEFRALTQLRAAAGPWRPVGPKGGIHGGVMLVNVATELGTMTPDVVPMLPDDPRA